MTIPIHRTLAGLVRDPLLAFEQIGRECDGALARLNVGVIRPYLVTHPDHVQHVLRNPDSFRREGMMWRPLRRLVGDGIASEGDSWQRSRRVLQPLLAARNVNAMLGPMAGAISEALDRLATRAEGGRPVDLTVELMRITQQVMIRLFFGDRISHSDADRLGDAIDTAFQSMSWRLLLPFAGDSVPVPGDRAFGRAVATVDELIYPLVHASRTGGAAGGATGGDLVDRFAGAVDEHGKPFTDKQIRDDLVAMFVAGTDTLALTMTWLFLLLDAHPSAAARLTDEVTTVVGAGPLAPEHLPGLVYTRMALEETLRLYPITWMIPRTVAEREVIDGTVLRPGATVVLSPYLTHRLPAFWRDPHEFRPERFAPDREPGRHRFAYLPFSAGVHQCLGNHLSLREGQLAVAGIVSRFRPRVVGRVKLRPRARIDLRPVGQTQLVLEPRG